MGKYDPPEHRNYEWISAAFQESIDPVLEAAVQCELRSEDLVFAKDQKQTSDRNP